MSRRWLVEVIKLVVFTGLKLSILLRITISTALIELSIWITSLLIATRARRTTLLLLTSFILILPSVRTDVHLVFLVYRVQFSHGRREITVKRHFLVAPRRFKSNHVRILDLDLMLDCDFILHDVLLR